MSLVLFPPAGIHPAVYAPVAPAVAKTTSDSRVAPAAGSDAAASNFDTNRGHTPWLGFPPAGEDGNHAAPPTILQLKINSMLQEQARERVKETAAAPEDIAPAHREAPEATAAEASPANGNQADRSAPETDDTAKATRDARPLDDPMAVLASLSLRTALSSLP